MNDKDVFELRREAKVLFGHEKRDKLLEALKLAEQQYENGVGYTPPPLFDAWAYHKWQEQIDQEKERQIKELSKVLLDLCEYYLSIDDISQTNGYFNRLEEINLNNEDEKIEKQIKSLRPKVDIDYLEIKKAEELSNNENHEEALNVFKKIIVEKRLSEKYHEAYGWVIYHYLKSKIGEISKEEIKHYLVEYLNLKNERPSKLHSFILILAVQISKIFNEFNLSTFLKKWDIKKLREDDKNSHNEFGQKFPSLISRVVKQLIEKDKNIDIEYLINNVELISNTSDVSNRIAVLDLIREPFFWKIYNAHKEGRAYEMWDEFENYNNIFSKYEKSKFHSKVLSLAERFMQDNDEWRFFDFFRKWDPQNFLAEDWVEEKKENQAYKPLAIKCIKKAYGNVKKDNSLGKNSLWLVEVYSTAIDKLSDDEWLKREKALLSLIIGDYETAISIYRTLSIELRNQYYIWNEFASCINDNQDVKLGMLSVAMLIEKNEDYLGEIHLEIAKILIDKKLTENALVELEKYYKHRELKEWNISKLYHELNSKIKDVKTNLTNNDSLYESYKTIAEEFAYRDIKWKEFVLIDSWIDNDGIKWCRFSDGEYIDFNSKREKYDILKNAEIGNVFNCKVFYESTNKNPTIKQTIRQVLSLKIIPLLIEKSDKRNWESLKDEYAYVEYINRDKGFIHTITTKDKEFFFQDNITKYKVGDIIRGKKLSILRENDFKIELKQISIVEDESLIYMFNKHLAVVDHINIEKNLFHYVVDYSIHGIIQFDQTELRPNVGDFINIFAIKKNNNKTNKSYLKVLGVKETNESSDSLIKTIEGVLEIKHKGFSDIEALNFLVIPDFAFIDDHYVSHEILKLNNIMFNCRVLAKLIFTGDNWKVLSIEKILKIYKY
jgi:hypothetical protein